MSIERGNLVDLDQGEPHFLGQRREVACMQAPEIVLQQVQMFDQQVAPPLALPEQSLHLGECSGIDLPPLRMIGAAPPPRTGMDAPVVLYGRRHGCSRAEL